MMIPVVDILCMNDLYSIIRSGLARPNDVRVGQALETCPILNF